MKNDNGVGFICYFGDLSSEEVEVINDYWLVTDDGGVNGGFAYSVSRVSERHGLREGDIRVIIKKGSGFCAPGGVGLCGSCGDAVVFNLVVHMAATKQPLYCPLFPAACLG